MAGIHVSLTGIALSSCVIVWKLESYMKSVLAGRITYANDLVRLVPSHVKIVKPTRCVQRSLAVGPLLYIHLPLLWRTIQYTSILMQLMIQINHGKMTISLYPSTSSGIIWCWWKLCQARSYCWGERNTYEDSIILHRNFLSSTTCFVS